MLPGKIMVPVVMAVCFMGAFATRGRVGDLVVAAVFGLMGYLMDRFDFSRADFVIGMVLATMIERNLHISLTLYGNGFLLRRPVALALFLLVVFTTGYPILRQYLKRRNGNGEAAAR
jgi:TctA family transporter